jgi:hypothetical protein
MKLTSLTYSGLETKPFPSPPLSLKCFSRECKTRYIKSHLEQILIIFKIAEVLSSLTENGYV